MVSRNNLTLLITRKKNVTQTRIFLKDSREKKRDPSLALPNFLVQPAKTSFSLMYAIWVFLFISLYDSQGVTLKTHD